MLLFPRRSLIAAFLLVSSTFSACAQRSGTPPILPDPKLTPGDVLDVMLADIQEKGYSAKVRNVPVSVKRDVYAAYGIQHWTTGEYEIDHLVSLSLGGSNSKKNLWPQSYKTSPWNAHTKDQLEYRLLLLVRSGKVDLHTAQQAMAKDWISAYKKYVSLVPHAGKATGGRRSPVTAHEAGDAIGLMDEDPDMDAAPTKPAAAKPPSSTPSAGGLSARVWVNTNSGVIWRPGSRFYGKTAKGKYMSEADALAAGYHEAK